MSDFRHFSSVVAKAICNHLHLNSTSLSSDTNLYGGLLGELVALNYIAACLRDDAIQQAAREIALQWARFTTPIPRSGGLFSGRLAVVYANLVFSSLFRDPIFLANAKRLLLSGAETDIHELGDTGLDLSYGASGLLLCQVRLAELAAGDETYVRVSKLAGLLAGTIDRRSDEELISSVGVGLAHGMSGLSLALGLAGEALDDTDVRRSVLRLERVERRSYYGSALQQHATIGNPSWCQSALGIGFSRLCQQQFAPRGDEKSLDLSHALSTALEPHIGALRSVCCGAWGRVELLRAVAYRLNEPGFLTMARKLASFLLAAPLSAADVAGLGLFRGWGGIACVAAGLVSDPPAPILLGFELWK